MRISDWSSDVCSSDLITTATPRQAREPLSCVLQPSQCGEARRRCSTLSAISEPATVRNHSTARWPPPKAVHMPVTHMPGEGKPAGHADRPAVAMPGSSLYDAGFLPLRPSTIKLLLPCSSIGGAHVLTPVTNAHIVCRLLLENK